MRKIYVYAVGIALIGAMVLSGWQTSDGLNQAAKQVYTQYQADWEAQLAPLAALQQALSKPAADPQACQALYLQARLSFKKAAFVAEYLDPEYMSDYINGAPLPKLERNFSQVHALEPKGYQPLEELVFEVAYDADVQKAALQLCRDLHSYVQDFGCFNRQRRLQDYQLIEAIRMGLIRFFSLGLTGFDVPASGRQLEELRTSWQSLQEASAALAQAEQGSLHQRIAAHWQVGQRFLAAATDFEAMDRMYLLRTCINPLFADLLQLHEQSDLPTSAQLYPNKRALNLAANNLFDPNILNPYFYMQLVPEADHPTLAALGKLLFFDPVLSASNDRACASCHQPEQAFSDGLPKSIATGFNGTVQRNAPGLINSVYAPRFFWDLRAMQLESQFTHVVVSEQEFNTSVLDIMGRLQASDEYAALFDAAFPQLKGRAIHQYTINSALAAYVASLRSFNSPFDQYVRGESETLAEEVKQGFNLFMGKALCGTCHFAPTFSGIVPPLYAEQESEVLGVPAQPVAPFSLDTDLGRAMGLPREQHPIYNHAFKTVTVRNAALTAPYMHNGVYNTLEEVVAFYHKGGGAGLGLDVPNQTLPFDSLSLTAIEQQALVAFMEALTDTAGLTSRPTRLPIINHQMVLNERQIGGVY